VCRWWLRLLALVAGPRVSFADEATHEDSEAELAKKLQNPVADRISVPIQNNWTSASGRRMP
jgi:hypothetical protein